MGRACSAHGEMRNACKSLVAKPEWKRTLGRPRHRWEDNIKFRLTEMEVWRCGFDSSGPVVGFCEHGNEPSGSIMTGHLLTS
jgi:hypothetical protein